jgi:choline dehydrogenase-like flavoprotein
MAVNGMLPSPRSRAWSDQIHADAIVIGSGPGGATVARGLAQAGWRVLILERGQDQRHHPTYGTYLGALRYAERGSLLYSHEGMQIIRPLLLGGATSMYCGCAAPPPDWLVTRYGIDLSAEVAESMEELGIAPLPPSLRGAASTKIALAATQLGMDWQPQAKLISPGRAAQFTCGAHCMLGCRCGAKWNAASFVDQAVAAGAILHTGVHVDNLIREGQRVVGVTGYRHGRFFRAHADHVILAAGGIGSPRILAASGIPAGEGLTVDTTLMVYGFSPEGGIGREPPMTWAWHHPEDTFMLSTLVDPWLMYPLAIAQADLAQIGSWADWGNMLGVMIKIKDSVAGTVGQRSISKPATTRDRAIISEARRIARQILVAAGADRHRLITTPLRGTHPASTVRIGHLVDSDLRSESAGLYVCDASIFPEALARPTVLTIIGFGKRLVRQLTSGRR